MSLKIPGWLRVVDVVFGLSSILFGCLVAIFPGFGVASLVYLLSFGIFLASIRAISLIWFPELPIGLRIVEVIAGIVGVFTSLLVPLFPWFGLATLILLLAVGLGAYGFSRIYYGYSHKSLASWRRWLSIVVGALVVLLILAVLAVPGLALLTLAVILAFAMIVSGVEMVISGASGFSSSGLEEKPRGSEPQKPSSTSTG